MRFVIMLLAIVATPSLVHAQGADFEVTGGASLNGFTYTQQGALQYRGRAFSPAVTAHPHVARFRITRSPSSPLAAAIAVDADGANVLYLLDTETFVSRREILCTPQRTLLSPSQRHMVVHCSYSGDSFVSIDLQSRRVLIGNHLGWEPAVVDPNELKRAVGTKIWRLTSEPQWMGSTDVLTFSVDEYCTRGTSRSCTDQAAITATASYEVRLDAATLQVRATARGPNRDRCAGERIRCSGARGRAQDPEPMRDVGFGEFTRGGFLYDLPVSFRIPAGYVAVRSRGEATRTIWASPADTAALAANLLHTMHDGFYSVNLSPNMGYDVDTDRFIGGGRDASTMKAEFEARGFTAVSLKRHRINGYPVLIVEGEKDGRRYVVVYVASLVDTNVVYAYYEHPEPMRELDWERWDAFKAAILASPPPPAR
jgi:hypothetical protein